MNDQEQHTFTYPGFVPVYFGRQDFVIAYAMGKKVLHLGCVDQGLAEEKYNIGIYMHARLHAVCSDLWGIDLDEPGIRWMEKMGWKQLLIGNIEELAPSSPLFMQDFDLLVLSEVIEHLDNPGRFLQTIRPLFRPQTELLITTPNAMRFQNFLSNYQRTEVVHPDHNFWFSFHTLKRLLTKNGYDIVKTAVYTQGSYHRLLAGRFFKPPIQLEIPDRSGSATGGSSNLPGKKTQSLVKRIKRNFTALVHGILLNRNPFFADGLIFIVKPTEFFE